MELFGMPDVYKRQVTPKKGLFPVGRLDKDTEGLLLITNDGELSHNLLSPTKHVDKTYYVELNGDLIDSDIELFKKGLDIGEKNLTKPAILKILEKRSTALITITEGKYHQVKRMFQAIGLTVTFLKRLTTVSYTHLIILSVIRVLRIILIIQ